MSDNVVIYHNKCLDGLTALSVFLAFKDSNPLIIPGMHGKDLEVDMSVFKDKHVYFLDFTYQLETLTAISEHAASITIIDHHESNKVMLFSLPSDKYTVVFADDECGTSLSFKTFKPEGYKNKGIEDLILAVRDQDIWVWEQPNSIAITASLNGIEKTVESFRNVIVPLFSDESKAIQFLEFQEQSGSLIYKTRYEIAESIASRAKKVSLPFETKTQFYLVNCPSDSVNLVSTVLSDLPVITYSIAHNVKFSLRCRKDDYNMIPVAKWIHSSGGGHKSACGSDLSFEEFENHFIKDLILS